MTPHEPILGGGYHAIPVDLDGGLTSTARPHLEPGDPATVVLVWSILLGWTIDQCSLSTSWVGVTVLLLMAASIATLVGRRAGWSAMPAPEGERGFQATNTADQARDSAQLGITRAMSHRFQRRQPEGHLLLCRLRALPTEVPRDRTDRS